MGRTIHIKTGQVVASATLNDTPTAAAIWEALPLEAVANRWGDEIYFAIPVDQALDEGAREGMSVGELAYWPSGKAFCIFFGPTPVSVNDEPRAYSPVNPIGAVAGDARVFASVKDGERILLERA